jgi:hypothetical protein
MAIGYKLIGKPVEGIDTSVFTTLSQTLLDQEATREKQRQAWRDEQDALRKSQGDLTPTVNQEANQFFGKFSQGIMDVSTTLQRQLETGEISSSEYTAQWRNLNQSNEQMIAAQTSYQETAQKITEDVANGITSAVNTLNLNHFNKVFQPGAMEVESDGRGGLRLFNKETGQVVSPSYLSNLTNSNLPKYDYMKVADTLVEQFGKRGVIDAAGNSIKGVYANMKDDDLDTLIEKEAKSLLEGSQAPTVSILVDGMGYNVVYSKDELKPAEAGKPGFVYRKPDGTFELAEGDQAKAIEFMKNALKNALPLEKEDAPIKQEKPLSDTEKSKISLRRKELGYLRSIDNVISGDTSTAKASIDAMIQGANVIYGKSPGIPNIQNALRSEDGNTLTVTRINEEGSITSTPYDISDPNKAGEVMVELFFPDVKGSYEELLTDYNRQGGFTTRKIENPKYDPQDVDDNGVPKQQRFIDNPNYKGASTASKTEAEVTIEQDFDTAEVLGKKAGDEKLLKDIIADVDVGTYLFSADAPLARSKAMNEGAEKAFDVLKIDFPNIDVRTKATANGLEIKIPSLFEGTLTLTNEYTIGGQTKQNFKDAIKQIFNAIAKNSPFDKTDFE